MGQASSTVLQDAIEKYKTKICRTKASSSCDWIPNPNVDATRRFIGLSFAGTETAVGEPFGTWSRSHIGEWYTLKDHAAFVAFGLGIPIRVAFEQNSLILAKCQQATGPVQGEMVAAGVVTEVDPNKAKTWSHAVSEVWRFFTAFVKNVLADGLPSWRTVFYHRIEFQSFGEKISAAMESVQPHHPSYVHWYVLVMGTHPQHQGKGHGAEIMKHIGVLADGAGRACFLECGESNRVFYEKMGYRIIAKETVHDPVDPKGEPLLTYAMLRTPNNNETNQNRLKHD